jgi:aspartate/methionine/tyrosine aminotransferase
MAAYEMGYSEACKPLLEPINASRRLIKDFLDEHGLKYILGKGYYAFINVKPWLERRGWSTSTEIGRHLAEEFGLAIVPGEYFSPFGREWIRFSYALPVEKTLAAAQRLVDGLEALYT